ncbi:MAG: DUF3256 family protein [Mediterranea sp.]|jgi:hypothetical protein|nr:DUF3256 family protein [Mediterranea sp.]
MRIIKLLLLFALGLCNSLHAQDIKTLFTEMPDSLCMLLTSVNRADFIDFLESNMKAEVTNKFGGKSEMTRLSSDYIYLQTTQQSSMQMKLLAAGDSAHVICVVSTACASACDSSIRFYTTQWKELSADTLLTLPRMGDFISIPDTVQSYAVRDAYEAADMLLLKADLSADDNTLTFTFTTPDYMNADVVQTLTPYIRREKVCRWNGKRFL